MKDAFIVAGYALLLFSLVFSIWRLYDAIWRVGDAIHTQTVMLDGVSKSLDTIKARMPYRGVVR